MLFGQARIGDEMEIVVLGKMNKKTAFVQRTSGRPWYTPIGREIKLHILKNAVKEHGENIIRLDRMPVEKKKPKRKIIPVMPIHMQKKVLEIMMKD